MLAKNVRNYQCKHVTKMPVNNYLVLVVFHCFVLLQKPTRKLTYYPYQFISAVNSFFPSLQVKPDSRAKAALRVEVILV